MHRPTALTAAVAVFLTLTAAPTTGAAQCRRECRAGEKYNAEGCCVADGNTRRNGAKVDKLSQKLTWMMPKGTFFVASVNPKSLRRAGIDMKLIEQQFAGAPEAATFFAEMRKTAKLDPFRDIERIWLLFATENVEREPRPYFVIKTRAKQANIEAWARKVGHIDEQQLEWSEGKSERVVTLFGDFTIAFFPGGWMVIAERPKRLAPVFEQWHSKNRTVTPGLLAAMKSAGTRTDLWAASVMPIGAADALRKERDATHWAEASFASASCRITKNSFKANGRIEFRGSGLDAAHNQLAAALSEIASDRDVQRAGLSGFFRGIRLTTRGKQLRGTAEMATATARGFILSLPDIMR